MAVIRCGRPGAIGSISGVRLTVVDGGVRASHAAANPYLSLHSGKGGGTDF